MKAFALPQRFQKGRPMFTLPTLWQTALPPALQNVLPAALPQSMQVALPGAWPVAAWPTAAWPTAAWPTAFAFKWPGESAAALPAPLPAGSPSGLPAELFNATRTLAESQLAGCNALLQAAFKSSASLFDLHVHATRDGLAAANAVSSQLMFVREPRDLVCLTASQSQQAMDRAQRYGRQVAGVANEAQHRLGELSKDFAGSLPRNPIE
jgi:hypothetical protein